jgi:hypothetical protein
MSAAWLFRRHTPANRAARRRRRPAVECLEDRLAPAVINVISTADNTNPVITAGHAGTAADPFLAPSLRSAISFANNATDGANNVINLTVAGTYKITRAGTAGETDNAAGEFAIRPSGTNGSSLVIQNTSGGVATIDGNHLNRVFDINPANATTTPQFAVTMSGFTITNGDAFDAANPDGPTSTGGGIRDQNNVSLTLTSMVITNNVANADGGGVVMENGVNIGTWTLTVSACTISNNHSGDAGGGIDTDGTGTVLINLGTVVTGNTDVNQGAGVYIDTIAVGATFPGASMTMTGTVVSDNQATNTGVTASGGGISNAGDGTMTIANSTVAGNFSGGSGGGFSDENNVGTLVVSNSRFLDNAAVVGGGGIQEGGPATTITNTVIQGNTSSATGGGMFLNGTAVSIQDSTIVDNTAVVGGGGIEVQTTGTGASGTTITNSTITANSATGNAAGPTTANGGGIEAPATTFTGSLTLADDTINGNFATNGGGVFWGGTTGSFALQNTIVAGNFAGTGPDADNNGGPNFTDSGGNLIGIAGAGSGNTGFTAATTQTGTTATPLDPLLGPLQNNGGPTPTELPLPGSPVINKGVNANIPLGITTDQRGFLRIVGNTVDVGAVEFQPPATVLQLNVSPNPVPPGQSVTFTATIAAQANGSNPVTGTVTFSVDGTPQTPAPISNGVATLTTTLAPGTHAVTAAYSGDFNFTPNTTGPVSVTVQGLRDVTSQVTITVVTPKGGKGKKRVKKNPLRPTLRITNKTATAISGPLYLVLDRLTRGVKLTNASGTTKGAHPAAGDPFVQLSLSGNQLGAGQSVDVTLNFAVAKKGKKTVTPTFSSFVFAGLGQI